MFRIAVLAACLGLLAALGGAHAQDKAKDAPKKDAPKDKEKAKTPPKVAGPAPTVADIHYGDHPRQVIDFWQAKSDKPTPLVLMIHGGGWVNGSKDGYRGAAPGYLKEGISVAAINYRMVPEATKEGIDPPVKWPLSDAARALQFIRSKAKEWNIDKERIGATGAPPAVAPRCGWPSIPTWPIPRAPIPSRASPRASGAPRCRAPRPPSTRRSCANGCPTTVTAGTPSPSPPRRAATPPSPRSTTTARSCCPRSTNIPPLPCLQG